MIPFDDPIISAALLTFYPARDRYYAQRRCARRAHTDPTRADAEAQAHAAWRSAYLALSIATRRLNELINDHLPTPTLRA